MDGSKKPADVRDFRLVHLALRRGVEQLTAAADRLSPADAGRLIGSRWALYSRSLHHHHVSEDDVIFPVVRARHGDFAALEEQLRAEHGELDEIIASVDAGVAGLAAQPDEARAVSLRSALQRFREVLGAHLDLEDERLLPMVADVLTEAEWKAMNTKILRGVPRADLPLVAGALDEVARGLPEAERPPPPPLPLRVLLALQWRRRYARWIAPLLV